MGMFKARRIKTDFNYTTILYDKCGIRSVKIIIIGIEGEKWAGKLKSRSEIPFYLGCYITHISWSVQ